jgi:hypothetical protein
MALIRTRDAAQAQSVPPATSRVGAAQDIRRFVPQPFAAVPRSQYRSSAARVIGCALPTRPKGHSGPPITNGVNIRVQIKKHYQGQPKQMALWGNSAAQYRYKHVIVVEEDIF